MYKLGFLFSLFLIASCSKDCDCNPETGKIFTVSVSEGTGPGTLHAAIRNANMESEPCKIVFDKIYSISLKEDLPEILCSVTIDGGKDGVTIDAEGKRPIFTIVRTEDTIPETVSFSNLTLTGGYAEDGGAIACLVVMNDLNVDATSFIPLSVNDCIFINNKTENYGGAIFSKSRISINHCKFIGNESSWGGAINVGALKSLNIQHSIFERNNALYGGAISVDYETGIRITDCAFSNNEAYNMDEYGNTGYGGAISTGNSLYIFNSIFNNNRSNGRGGAIDLHGPYGGISFLCINSTFVENSADGRGGAIRTGDAFVPRPSSAHTLYFAYCTFYGNKSGGMGGAIFGPGGCYFLNNIFTGNKVSDESTDYYDNILTGNKTSPETTSDFLAGYLYMEYNIFDKIYYDENWYSTHNVKNNVRATAFEIFGTDLPQLKDNIIAVLPNSPADGLGRPVNLDLGNLYLSFNYRDNGKWFRLHDGSEYTGSPNDTIFVSDQTGFLRPDNNITVGAWQIR